MRLLNRLLKRKDKGGAKPVKPVAKFHNISWVKLIGGIVLCLVGLVSMIFYLRNYQNLMAGAFAVFTIGPGVMLLFFILKTNESGFAFSGKGVYTGNENAILLLAQRSGENGEGKDKPIGIRFMALPEKAIPGGARLHYVRNLKKHFYELYNDTTTKKLKPVVLPDKKSFSPELFRIPSCMETYKDAIDYTPPSMLQKVAPGVLLLAMGIVGLLMVITGG